MIFWPILRRATSLSLILLNFWILRQFILYLRPITERVSPFFTTCGTPSSSASAAAVFSCTGLSPGRAGMTSVLPLTRRCTLGLTAFRSLTATRLSRATRSHVSPVRTMWRAGPATGAASGICSRAAGAGCLSGRASTTCSGCVMVTGAAGAACGTRGSAAGAAAGAGVWATVGGAGSVVAISTVSVVFLNQVLRI